jgi:hypothetical protein
MKVDKIIGVPMQTIINISGVLGFLVSLGLAIYKIFFENKSIIKLEITIDNIFQLDGKLSEPLLLLTVINKGFGSVYLYRIGFRNTYSEYIFLKFEDLSNKIPRKIEERDNVTFLYPVRKFIAIKNISHFIVEDGTGKYWKKRFSQKINKKLINLDITKGGKFPEEFITMENPFDM